MIKYEILVVTKALDLLDHVSRTELLHRSSLEADEAEIERVGPAEWELYTLLKLNVVTKKVYFGQKKTLEILLAILKQLAEISPGDQRAFAKVTFSRISTLEDSDSDTEFFKRRMGLRNYLK